ncbi:hypothetical protein [Salinibacter grassmerensis]|uniref:hypothetical protein n=1 Tax=Salinibacter grassmerensis TaxID=3040353 RepID=UPI0021E91F63|nr:hypothetical protein [Salinibacter grassmerensis]
MVSSVLDLLPRLRPRAGQFPEEARSQVQGHRLLSLLGAGLVMGFASLYAVASPSAVDLLWARVGIAGVCLHSSPCRIAPSASGTPTMPCV